MRKFNIFQFLIIINSTVYCHFDIRHICEYQRRMAAAHLELVNLRTGKLWRVMRLRKANRRTCSSPCQTYTDPRAHERKKMEKRKEVLLEKLSPRTVSPYLKRSEVENSSAGNSYEVLSRPSTWAMSILEVRRSSQREIIILISSLREGCPRREYCIKCRKPSEGGSNLPKRNGFIRSEEAKVWDYERNRGSEGRCPQRRLVFPNLRSTNYQI